MFSLKTFFYLNLYQFKELNVYSGETVGALIQGNYKLVKYSGIEFLYDNCDSKQLDHYGI